MKEINISADGFEPSLDEVLAEVRRKAEIYSEEPGVNYRDGYYVIDDPLDYKHDTSLIQELAEMQREQDRHDEKVRSRLSFLRNFSMGATFGFFASFLMTVFM